MKRPEFGLVTMFVSAEVLSVTSPAQRGRSDAVAAGRGCVVAGARFDTDIHFTLSLA